MARALRSLSRSVVTKLVFLELEGHTQSTCTVDIFTYFYIACRNFTAFGRCALENSAKPAKDMPAHWLTPCSLSHRGPALRVVYMCDLALPRVLHSIMLFWEEGGASWVDGSPLQQRTDAATRSMKTKFQWVIKVFSFNDSTSAV